MESLQPITEPPPVRIVASALAHLARHMQTGCPHSAYLAAMLLEKVAQDPEADDHLRRHARVLVEILNRDGERAAAHDDAAPERPASASKARGILIGAF